MGKRDYALRLYGAFASVHDLSRDDPDRISPGLIMNLHEGARVLLHAGIRPSDFFAGKIDVLRECVITGDEIGGGVVPADSFLRKWRDETGKLYQYLAREADIVDRVFAGLAVRMKPCTYSSTSTIL